DTLGMAWGHPSGHLKAAIPTIDAPVTSLRTHDAIRRLDADLDASASFPRIIKERAARPRSRPARLKDQGQAAIPDEARPDSPGRGPPSRPSSSSQDEMASGSPGDDTTGASSRPSRSTQGDLASGLSSTRGDEVASARSSSSIQDEMASGSPAATWPSASRSR